MIAVAAFGALGVLVAVVIARPHGVGPALGAAAAVAIAAAGGAVGVDDAREAGETLWRPFLTLASIMTMTAAAERLGLLDRVAAVIEPRTRGPVRHAYRITFVLAALVAAVLSNDAAILLMTPIVLTLIRHVYPKRRGKFLVPFGFAVFAAAGVAPLVTSNPMNLVVAERAGIGFNTYAASMIPVALAGWVAAYLVLARVFRDVLVDEAPALGAWPPHPPLGAPGWIVLAALGVVLVAYPVVSYLDGPLWLVATAGATVCAAATLAAGHGPRALAGAVSWSVFPFLAGVYLLAIALERAGVVARLAALYGAGDASLVTIGVTSAVGSAVLNNHPMAVLNVLALDGAPTSYVLAALVGGDLGPRLLPMGSLAGLLWFDVLRRHGVTVSVATFVRVGALVTIPSLAVSLVVLWLVT